MAHFPGSDSVLIRPTVDLGTIYAENESLEDTITNVERSHRAGDGKYIGGLKTFRFISVDVKLVFTG